MLKKFLTLLCLLAPLALQAQNADMRFGTLMNEGRWFELERARKTTPKDSLHPLLYQMATAMTHHYFNRPDSACIVLTDLLSNHQQELGGNTLNMVMLLGINQARTDRYAEATDLMQSLYDQLTAQGVDSTQTADYAALIRQWRALAPYAPLCRPLHPAGTYRLPMKTDNTMHTTKDKTNDGHFLTLNGSINGQNSQLIFDTGSGGNIIPQELARQYGLRILENNQSLSGISRKKGQLALADTLRIGDMAWANVPFFVIDIRTGHAEADSISTQILPVIGLPIMLQMQEIQMDFAHHEFVIPATPTPNPLGESNLLRTESENLRLATTDGEDHPLHFHFDTGSYYTNLLPHWYTQHKAEVDAIGTPDSLRTAGIGAVSITRSYRLPQMEFRIGHGTAVLDSVSVDTGIGLHDGQPQMDAYLSGEEDGTIGLNLLERFKRVILNLKEMYMEAVAE